VNPTKLHPNASAAAVAGALTTVVLYVLTYAGVHPPAAFDAACSTLAAFVVLLLPGAKGQR
jgi:hypothetical protein